MLYPSIGSRRNDHKNWAAGVRSKWAALIRLRFHDLLLQSGECIAQIVVSYGTCQG